MVVVVGRPSVCCRPRQSLPMAIHGKGCTHSVGGEDRSVAITTTWKVPSL